jgi:flagellar biosynthetic protein FliR
MSVEELLNVVPVFVLVVFRIAGMMIFAPLFGSAKIPKRVKIMFTVVLAMGMMAGVKTPPQMPATPWELTIGIAGEMAFGLAMGTMVSLIFIAAQWAGEIIGQQMGLNAGELFDPIYGGAGNLVGDLYQMLTLTVFLAVGGQYALLRGVRASFDSLPLLSAGINQSLVDLLVGVFQSTAMLAIQLAAPMLVTMLVVDLALGVIGKTMPQLNVMSMGLTVRAMIGVLVLILGLSLTSDVIRHGLLDVLDTVQQQWTAVKNTN